MQNLYAIAIRPTAIMNYLCTANAALIKYLRSGNHRAVRILSPWKVGFGLKAERRISESRVGRVGSNESKREHDVFIYCTITHDFSTEVGGLCK